jgi:hypothetical protein
MLLLLLLLLPLLLLLLLLQQSVMEGPQPPHKAPVSVDVPLNLEAIGSHLAPCCCPVCTCVVLCYVGCEGPAAVQLHQHVVKC